MGSSGSGNFTDYSGVNQSSGSGKSGGASGENRCNKAFNALLEDVERCTYYTTNGDVPPVGTNLKIAFNQRLVAITNDGIEVGYLPTKFNYIKLCLTEGFTYEGAVVRASNIPFATVSVDFGPNV